MFFSRLDGRRDPRVKGPSYLIIPRAVIITVAIALDPSAKVVFVGFPAVLTVLRPCSVGSQCSVYSEFPLRGL